MTMAATKPTRLFERACRVTVDGVAITYAGDEPRPDGRAYDGLRVGFTIDKDLSVRPNSVELAIYNLSRSTRKRLADADYVPVLVEAGYRETGLTLLFAGEMREAFSRADTDGSMVTILRAGDADQAIKKGRKATSYRPGVSASRVLSETLSGLRIGQGNVDIALENHGTGGTDDPFKMGLNVHGPAMESLRKLLHAEGLEISAQDGEAQVLKAGGSLTLRKEDATFLSPATGLEGTAEVTNKDRVTCKARIMPGLSPGHLVELDTEMQSVERLGTGWYAFAVVPEGALYVVEKVRYVGDTRGQDWTCELSLRDLTGYLDDQEKAKAAAAAAAKKAKKKPPAKPAEKPK
jgi:hypothetical protein